MAALRNLDSEDVTYLGFPMRVTRDDVTVRTPDGRRIARVWSLGAARQVVRGHRKAIRDERTA